MNFIFRIGMLVAVTTLLMACGNLQRQSRTFDTTGTSGITVDASQRAIYSVTKKYSTNKQWQAFCAEPSPDGISALISSFGLDASAAGKSLGLATNNQDSVTSIGLRTQTITMLRDAMYRLCEGYASGALNGNGFMRLQRRYQHTMLALLAIEQLTGPVVAHQAALTGSSSAGLGKSLGDVAKLLSEAAADLATAEQAVSDAKAAEKTLTESLASAKASGSTSTPEQTADIEKKLDVAKKDTKAKSIKATGAQTYYTSMETNLKEAQRLIMQATSSADFRAVAGSQNSLGDSTFAKISANVTDIVKTTIKHDYTKDVCVDVLLSEDANDLDDDTFAVVVPLCAVAHKMTDDVQKKFFDAVDQRAEARKAKKKEKANTSKTNTAPVTQ